MSKTVSIILCSFNEEESLPIVIGSVHENMKNQPYNYEIIVVDDGSTDKTMDVVKELLSSDERLFYIQFSRNFGHQFALKAGLDHARGDCIISMDADMQHPPSLLPEFIKKWDEGYDVVYTCREDDRNLPLFKRKSSNLFYKIINSLSDVKIEQGTADFRLMDRKAANVIITLKETDLFMRGLVKWIGFKQYIIDYKPADRVAGTSKYTIKKMINFALQGITSFSVKPLHMALYIGFIIAALSFLYIPYVIYSLIYGHPLSGWASILVTIAFLGGMQLFVLGIIGIYIGKIFMQSKQRPVYIVKETNIIK